MVDQRKNIRYETSAKVIIKNVSDEKAQLKDISVTGCRIELVNYAEIKPNTRYKLKIIPEQTSEVESFFLAVESKWIGTEVNSFEFGFSIIESPKGKQFQRYVDYLSWRYSQGNSMTGDSGSEIL